MIIQPQAACPNCWRVWLAGAWSVIGYCWRGKIAWRVKPDNELLVAPGVTREEHRAMLEYVYDMESIFAAEFAALPRLVIEAPSQDAG